MIVRKKITLMILAISIVSACEKQPDYRDKYSGNWNFEIQSETIKDGGVVYNSGTSISNGEIKLGEGANEILLQFQGTHGQVTLSIDPDGKILPKTYSSNTSITISYTGGFEGNNKLQYVYHLNHGTQTNIFERLTGERE